MVVSADLGHPLSLEAVAKLPGTCYRPTVFPGLTYAFAIRRSFKRCRAKVLLFSSGKMIYAGAKSVPEARHVVSEVVKRLKEAGIVVLNEPKVEVQNIVVTASLNRNLDLSKATTALEGAVYEPSHFPALRYKIHGSNIAYVIFANGKLNCVGAKSATEASQAIDKLLLILREKGLTT